MKFILSAMAGALLAACSVVPAPNLPVPAPTAPAAVEPAPADTPAPKTKAKKKTRKELKEARGKKEQIRAVVSKGAVPDCGLIRWAASTFDEDRIKRLERSASAEQKKHAKACLDGRG